MGGAREGRVNTGGEAGNTQRDRMARVRQLTGSANRNAIATRMPMTGVQLVPDVTAPIRMAATNSAIQMRFGIVLGISRTAVQILKKPGGT